MGSVRPPGEVKLFCGLLLAPHIALQEVEDALARLYGPVSLRSAPLPFTHTTYYAREMGPQLTRLYVAFAPLIALGALAAIKHTTNALERQWEKAPEQRQVNIDPGYLDLAKVVLASTKDHMHRLYIGEGMFAEVTLRYRQQHFQPWEWTYPDYREPESLAFFEQLRAQYRTQVRASTTA